MNRAEWRALPAKERNQIRGAISGLVGGLKRAHGTPSNSQRWPRGKPAKREVLEPGDERTKPDWSGKCENCGESPVVPLTGMCGPCTFGEADTAGGNW